MDKRKSLMKGLKKFKEKIMKKYYPEKMIFFGSRVRGDFGEDSDVDLMIVSEKFKKVNILKRAPGLYIEWDLDYPVDFLCYTPEEFEKLKNGITLVSQVVNEGIEI